MKKAIKFLKDDLKGDWEALHKLGSGQIKRKHSWKEIFNVGPAIRTYWIFLLLVFAALAVGWSLAGMYYTIECHNVVMEKLDEVGVLSERTQFWSFGDDLTIENESLTSFPSSDTSFNTS